MEYTVGEVQGYPVIYIPERDMLFCKNTAVSVKRLKAAIWSSLEREYIEEKNLSVIKDRNIIYFGCLTTSMGNVELINSNINKIKRLNK